MKVVGILKRRGEYKPVILRLPLVLSLIACGLLLFCARVQALVPSLHLSETQCIFGECPVGERRDIQVTLKNTTPQLPITFGRRAATLHRADSSVHSVLPSCAEFGRVAHFSTRPESGRLDPLQSQTIMVTFRPAQLGLFRTDLPIALCKGTGTYITLHCAGQGTVPPVVEQTAIAAQSASEPTAMSGMTSPGAVTRSFGTTSRKGLRRGIPGTTRTGPMHAMLRPRDEPPAGTLRSFKDFEPKVCARGHCGGLDNEIVRRVRVLGNRLTLSTRVLRLSASKDHATSAAKSSVCVARAALLLGVRHACGTAVLDTPHRTLVHCRRSLLLSYRGTLPGLVRAWHTTASGIYA